MFQSFSMLLVDMGWRTPNTSCRGYLIHIFFHQVSITAWQWQHVLKRLPGTYTRAPVGMELLRVYSLLQCPIHSATCPWSVLIKRKRTQKVQNINTLVNKMTCVKLAIYHMRISNMRGVYCPGYYRSLCCGSLEDVINSCHYYGELGVINSSCNVSHQLQRVDNAVTNREIWASNKIRTRAGFIKVWLKNVAHQK